MSNLLLYFVLCSNISFADEMSDKLIGTWKHAMQTPLLTGTIKGSAYMDCI